MLSAVIHDYDYVFAENGLVAHKDGKLIGTQVLLRSNSFLPMQRSNLNFKNWGMPHFVHMQAVGRVSYLNSKILCTCKLLAEFLTSTPRFVQHLNVLAIIHMVLLDSLGLGYLTHNCRLAYEA